MQLHCIDSFTHTRMYVWESRLNQVFIGQRDCTARVYTSINAYLHVNTFTYLLFTRVCTCIHAMQYTCPRLGERLHGRLGNRPGLQHLHWSSDLRGHKGAAWSNEQNTECRVHKGIRDASAAAASIHVHAFVCICSVVSDEWKVDSSSERGVQIVGNA